jgi:hypothetical protein
MNLTTSIKTRRLPIALASVAILLTVISLGGPYVQYVLGYDYVRGFLPVYDGLFNLDWEATIPAWFSSMLLLLCAVLLAAIAWEARAAEHPFATSWAVLSGIFLYLSVDETAGIHESVKPLVLFLSGGDGVLASPWVVVGVLAVAVFVLSYLRFLFHLPRRTAVLFVIAGTLYVGGAIGLELLGHARWNRLGDKDWIYYLYVTAEELSEMLGAVLFAYALLEYLGRSGTAFQIRVVSDGAPATAHPPARQSELTTR